MCCLQRQPDWLFLSSWNEFIAQPQVAPQRSMGLETDASVGSLAFVVTCWQTGSHDQYAASQPCVPDHA
jgi:hypothetical protein